MPAPKRLRQHARLPEPEIIRATSRHTPKPVESDMSADEFHGDNRVAVDSTGDARIANNVVRHEYRVLSEREKEQMKSIEDAGRDFIEYLDHVGGTSEHSRELALAKTKVQEAVMWAVNHVTK